MSPYLLNFTLLRGRRYGAVAAILVVSALTASPAVAEGDDPPATENTKEDDTPEAGDGDRLTVRTTDGDDRWRDDDRFPSGMTTRVDTDDLSLRAETIGDALSRVTGTYVRRQSSYGQPAHLSIRGANPRQVVVDLDGLRLSAPAGTGFDVGSMMSHGVSSADILRGAAAASRGGGAVAGAMQLRPAHAPDDGVEIRGRLLGGSFGTASTEADIGVGNGVGGLLLSGGVRHSDGDFPFTDHRDETRRRINNEHRRIGAGATGHLTSGAHTLRLTGRVETGESGRPGPSEFQQSFRHAQVDDRRALAALRWEGDDVWSNASVLVDAYATAGAHEFRQDYDNERQFLSGEPFASRSVERTAAVTGGLRAFVGDSHLVRLDAEGRSSSFRGRVDAPSRDDELYARRHTAALSATDEWLLADERISLVGAVRTEISDDETGDDEIRPLLPALGAVARLHRRLALRANAARTYRRPHFDELYLQTEHVRGNPDLDSEKAFVVDAGLQLGADDDPLRLQAGVFYHAMDSLILFLPASAHHYEARNLHGATSRGLEMSAGTDLGDRIAVQAGYTYTRAALDDRDDDSPPQLPGQPRHRLHLESEIEVLEPESDSRRPAFAMRPALHYRSSINLDNFGHLRNGDALRIDAGADVVLSPDLRLGLQLHNLLDHRRAVDALQRPLPGRAIFLSMEMKGAR